jgi:hypothetical protein
MGASCFLPSKTSAQTLGMGNYSIPRDAASDRDPSLCICQTLRRRVDIHLSVLEFGDSVNELDFVDNGWSVKAYTKTAIVSR